MADRTFPEVLYVLPAPGGTFRISTRARGDSALYIREDLHIAAMDKATKAPPAAPKGKPETSTKSVPKAASKSTAKRKAAQTTRYAPAQDD